jgi:hypothetical protein
MPERILQATPVPEINWFSWLMGCATALAIFFLAWGLKDVKRRFDLVPELESEIRILKSEVERLKNEKVAK